VDEIAQAENLMTRERVREWRATSERIRMPGVSIATVCAAILLGAIASASFARSTFVTGLCVVVGLACAGAVALRIRLNPILRGTWAFGVGSILLGLPELALHRPGDATSGSAFPQILLVCSGGLTLVLVYRLGRSVGMGIPTLLDGLLAGAGLAGLLIVLTYYDASTTAGRNEVMAISSITVQSLVVGATIAVAVTVGLDRQGVWLAIAVGYLLGPLSQALFEGVLDVTRVQADAIGRAMWFAQTLGVAVAAWCADLHPADPKDERQVRLTAAALPLFGLTATATALVIALSQLSRTSALVGASKQITLIPMVAAFLLATARVSIAIRSAQAFRVINELATTDELTGLANRRRLYQAVDDLVSTHPADSHALMLLDLNSFKEVNDTLGHPVGDALLIGIGRRLANTLPEKAILSRLGGDEFAVLVPFATEGEPARVAQLIRASLRTPFAIQGARLQVGCAIGGARFPEDGVDAVALLARADVAMYNAKRAGRTFQQYQPELETDILNRLKLMADLEKALAEGQFEVRYQPMMEVATGRVTGAEALVRWRHPERGLSSPAVFLELVEQTGVLPALTGVVMAEAVGTAAAWDAAGYDMQLAINIGSRELLDDQLVDNLFHELAQNGVAPGSVVVEVTEGAFIDTEISERIVRRLRAAGVLVAIDDFGAGYSSLSRLRALDAVALKLDRSLTAAMIDDPGAAAVVDSSIQLAHALGMRMVAEGVEDSVTFVKLRDLGCDGVQGYYIARPMNQTELITWLDEHSEPDDD